MDTSPGNFYAAQAPKPPSGRPEERIAIPPSELLQSPNVPKPEMPNLLLDPDAPDPELYEWLNLFEGVEQLDNSELANQEREKELLEIGRKNEIIEMAFEQAYLGAFIALHDRIRIDGWSKVYEQAVDKTIPNIFPLAKKLYPNLNDQKIKNILMQMGYRSMMKVAEGSITAPEIEAIKQAEAELQRNVQKTKTYFQPTEKPTRELRSTVRIETAAPSTTSFENMSSQEALNASEGTGLINLKELQQREMLRSTPPSLADIAGATAVPEKPAAPAAPRYPTPPSMRKKQE